MLKKFLFLLIVLESMAGMLNASEPPDDKKGRRIVSGHIRDAVNGEVLIGATLLVKETGTGTSSNNYGFYSMSLLPGTYTFTWSFVGYRNLVKQIDLRSNGVVEIELTPAPESLEEVTVTAGKNENISRIEMGIEKLRPQALRTIPALMGEVDLIKAVQLLPGVQTTSEGGSGFSVRGGTPDQNLILLDEATVYNASHLVGFFSVFNNDAINDLKLYKGDVPSQYGGRLASLLDVRMKDGNSKKFSGAGGVGAIASRLTLEGPLKRDRSTFLLSGRRTYMDLFLPLSSDDDVKNSRLYFYDLNLKLNHRVNAANRLFMSGYLGRDVLKSPDFNIGFGNQTFTLRWNHIFNPKLFMNLTALWSRYDYELGTADEDPDSWIWDSDLKDAGIKADLSWFTGPDQVLLLGLQSFHHQFNPGSARGTTEKSVYSDYTVERSYAFEHAGYLSYQHQIGDKLSLKYGVRASLFQSIGKATVYHYDDDHEVADSTLYGAGEVYNNYAGLEPRVGVNYMIRDDLAVKLNYNRSRQYIQQASNSSAGSPLDIWFPASPNVKPQVADQVSGGLFRNLRDGMYEVSVEVYYKQMHNTIDFADHAVLLLNKYLEGEIRTGKSKAYGLEFLAKKTEGDLTGWAGYTISRSERTMAGINHGKTYVAPFDRPHNFTAVMNYVVSKRVSLSANWLYATGQPVTIPEQRYEVRGNLVPYYSERNGARYDDYHRLDLSLVLKGRNRPKRQWTGEWVFSVYNAYCRKNTWMLSFRQDEDNPEKTYAEKTYLFPVIPSVTYNFKF
ncbi:MAG: TonB-dependent receptor [Prolixibacteraceae bacterium]